MKARYHDKRLSRLKAVMKDRRLDSMLVTGDKNVSYLSGFEGSDAALIITSDSRYFITDSRFAEEAKKEIKGFKVLCVQESTYKSISRIIKDERLKRVGFESMSLPYEVAIRLKSMIGEAGLVGVKNLVEGLRAVKDPEEIGLIKGSVALVRSVFSGIERSLRPGVSEDWIKRTIEIEFIRSGASAAFEPIVASGSNSSKPHARATGKILSNNDLVMIDIGSRLAGYNSDMTRTIFLGKVKSKLLKMYSIVEKARGLAFDTIKPGAKISKVDRAARGYIAGKGFGKFFGHSLGHGVGMDVHELPTISGSSDGTLSEGMVFTIEPAIYIPGFGGIRIEDMVLVTRNGYQILTG